MYAHYYQSNGGNSKGKNTDLMINIPSIKDIWEGVKELEIENGIMRSQVVRVIGEKIHVSPSTIYEYSSASILTMPLRSALFRVYGVQRFIGSDIPKTSAESLLFSESVQKQMAYPESRGDLIVRVRREEVYDHIVNLYGLDPVQNLDAVARILAVSKTTAHKLKSEDSMSLYLRRMIWFVTNISAESLLW
jgi:hypothetical protein